MKWVKDKTGRFPQRPHYQPDELDAECEQVVTRFLQERHGQVRFPISTDDLTVLLESKVADLDLYADLSEEDGEVEGETEFIVGEKPNVRISQTLSNNPAMINRLRTTLTHEFGHVRFHGFMFEIQAATPSLPFAAKRKLANKCLRGGMIHAGTTDWLEWQAGYTSGSLLMPKSALHREVSAFLQQASVPSGRIGVESQSAQELVVRVAQAFEVSQDAARVRLLQGKILVRAGEAMTRSLFSYG
jgi:hypothetical protein